MLEIDDFDRNGKWNAAGRTPVLLQANDLNIGGGEATQYRITSARQISIDHKIFCRSIVTTVCVSCGKITDRVARALRQGRILVKITAEFGHRGKHHQQNWQHDSQLHKLHARVTPLESRYPVKKLSPHEHRSLSIDNRFHNRWTGIGSGIWIVIATADNYPRTNVFDVDRAAIAPRNLASQKERSEVIDLDVATATTEFSRINERNQNHTTIGKAIMTWSLTWGAIQILLIGDALLNLEIRRKIIGMESAVIIV